ncbi:MAG: large conductance mechanosensitive channel protein MscL [Polynucleobacter sp.]|nr:MAG: large conductance mechanosensitive channel protein MscL [Polynucleobacter sp.]
MKMIQEFRAFAVRGNVVDLAVGVIIGGAFSKIVDSVVGDVVMPIVAWMIGGKLDFSNLFIVLGQIPENVPRTLDALKKAGVPLFAYGNFLTITLNFVILAFIIFQMVKVINRIKLQDEAETATETPPATPEDIQLLREIRDSLKNKENK